MVWVSPAVDRGFSHQRSGLIVPSATFNGYKTAIVSVLYAYKSFRANLTASKVDTGKEALKPAKTRPVLVAVGPWLPRG